MVRVYLDGMRNHLVFDTDQYAVSERGILTIIKDGLFLAQFNSRSWGLVEYVPTPEKEGEVK